MTFCMAGPGARFLPGSPEVTRKALSFIDNLTNESKIADIGCGTGGQTMVVADDAPGHITGIDLFPTFIDLFNINSRKRRVSVRRASELSLFSLNRLFSNSCQLIFLFVPEAPRRSMVSVRQSDSPAAGPRRGISDRSSGPCFKQVFICPVIGHLHFIHTTHHLSKN